jgi:predicted acylesterase/phospholipase RssA
MNLDERIAAPGPKRILALDGGGVRGMISLQILARIEELLRASTGNGALRLAEWFDFIGGTSTGAVIAACLALGLETREVLRFYEEAGPAMFHRSELVERLWYLYDQDPLAAKLREILGAETTLGSERIQTLLMIMMRNATTDSAWPVSNNPRAVYNDPRRANCNLRLPLWQLVRASTAAPVYFPAERMRIGGSRFLFQDGGVTPSNNPAFQMLVMATASPYRVNWKATRKDLLVVSVGTGLTTETNPEATAFGLNILELATTLPGVLIGGSQVQQDLMCRVFGECRFGLPIDREVGDLRRSRGPGRKLFSYVRYNAELDDATLGGLGLGHLRAGSIRRMDAVKHMGELAEVGRAVAAAQVQAEHFAGF